MSMIRLNGLKVGSIRNAQLSVINRTLSISAYSFNSTTPSNPTTPSTSPTTSTTPSTNLLSTKLIFNPDVNSNQEAPTLSELDNLNPLLHELPDEDYSKIKMPKNRKAKKKLRREIGIEQSALGQDKVWLKTNKSLSKSFTKEQLYNLCKLAKLKGLGPSFKNHMKEDLIEKILTQRFGLENSIKLKKEKEEEEKSIGVDFKELEKEEIVLFFKDDRERIGGKRLADSYGLQVDIVRVKEQVQIKKGKGKAKAKVKKNEIEKEKENEDPGRLGIRLQGKKHAIRRMDFWFETFHKSKRSFTFYMDSLPNTYQTSLRESSTSSNPILSSQIINEISKKTGVLIELFNPHSFSEVQESESQNEEFKIVIHSRNQTDLDLAKSYLLEYLGHLVEEKSKRLLLLSNNSNLKDSSQSRFSFKPEFTSDLKWYETSSLESKGKVSHRLISGNLISRKNQVLGEFNPVRSDEEEKDGRKASPDSWGFDSGIQDSNQINDGVKLVDLNSNEVVEEDGNLLESFKGGEVPNLPFLGSSLKTGPESLYRIKTSFGALYHSKKYAQSDLDFDSTKVSNFFNPPIREAFTIEDFKSLVSNQGEKGIDEVQEDASSRKSTVKSKTFFKPKTPRALAHLDSELSEARKNASTSSSMAAWSKNSHREDQDASANPGHNNNDSPSLSFEEFPKMLQDLKWTGEEFEEDLITLVYSLRTDSQEDEILRGSEEGWKLALNFKEELVGDAEDGRDVMAHQSGEDIEEEFYREDGKDRFEGQGELTQMTVKANLVNAYWIKDGARSDVLSPSSSMDFTMRSSSLLPADLEALRQVQPLQDWLRSVEKESTKKKKDSYSKFIKGGDASNQGSIEDPDPIPPFPLIFKGRTSCPDSFSISKSHEEAGESNELILVDRARISRTVWNLKEENDDFQSQLVREYVRRNGDEIGQASTSLEWITRSSQDLPNWQQIYPKIRIGFGG